MTEQKEYDVNNFIMLWPDDQPIESLFVSKLYNKGFYPKQIAMILKTIDETCNHCWDYPGRDCTCIRDE